MGLDVLRRIRWGNVALAVAVAAALFAVLAWPRLAPAPPGLPPDAAAPLVGSEAAPREDAESRGASAEPRRRAKPRGTVARRAGAGRKRASTPRREKRRPARPTPRRTKRRHAAPAPLAPRPPPAPVAAPRRPNAGSEFGFER
jgi:hypothetical protein